MLHDLHVRQDDKLFTFGISQGSHAALALHRALEQDGVDVTGTAIVGNILDPERWFLSGFTTTTVTLPL